MSEFPRGYQKRVFSSVDSTLDEARRIAGTLAGPTWILALAQTAARGRRGRIWHMPAGNFAATLVLAEDQPERAAMRSFVAALALCEACVALTGRDADFELKWPNDVLLRGGKLAGILLESSGFGAKLTHFAIGIGVNLMSAPEVSEVETGATRPVSLLSEAGVKVTPEEFLDLLAPAYAYYENQFTTYGFEPIRTAWLGCAARLGEVITARTTRESHVGTFETVDAAGNLVLSTAKSRMAIPAADVFF